MAPACAMSRIETVTMTRGDRAAAEHDPLAVRTDKALVLSLDEKCQIQALEPPSRACREVRAGGNHDPR